MRRRIVRMAAREILDSRGNPTVSTRVELDDGSHGVASVPSGASTGAYEAHELRDGDESRYGGKGVLRAVENVNDEIGPSLVGLDPLRQADIDDALSALDGTPAKSRLGANAILSVSMAVARAAAMACGLPLFAYLGGCTARRLPMPMMNVINGGSHAGNALDFQEFMLVPVGAHSFADALRYGAQTFHALGRLLEQQGHLTGVGDEGGFAPDLEDNQEACELIMAAIEAAGFAPGRDIAIALDPAASAFWEDGAYRLSKSGDGRKTSAEMTQMYARWLDLYPIVSIEDGLGEKDWAGFREHTALLGERAQIVGDDIYVTNSTFLERGIEEGTTNAALIKLNQIGTVTQTIQAVEMCRAAGWRFVISHRSGETEDSFIADLAVAMGGGQIKAGSPCRGERVAKYNRLLEIEQYLGPAALFRSPFERTSHAPASTVRRSVKP